MKKSLLSPALLIGSFMMLSAPVQAAEWTVQDSQDFNKGAAQFIGVASDEITTVTMVSAVLVGATLEISYKYKVDGSADSNAEATLQEGGTDTARHACSIMQSKVGHATNIDDVKVDHTFVFDNAYIVTSYNCSQF